ncbi:hypothetical protein SAMN04515674_11820 [Pseudarcicella hirudinis]|uniref:Glycosyltransferase 2-like domain-containing protein n=1 Tax=Pseudarcicella hirudinis TaxID=1079859 RepID=A0A1I5YCW8_9BACT|nr:glycosyltransferase family 2 protein [Pseudarcicella hirudinis]SFQ42029.1 hypothetical protein SAMN04515674_11820 [Pseudarcicella hirudinis]
MQTAIVILNYNGKSFLEKFLPSVVRHSVNIPVYVADNASTDDSVLFLQNQYPDIHLITLPVNFGYAGGYNEALAQIQAKYYILLNSDVEVTANWINPVIQLMETNPDIAACQPKIRSFHQKADFEYAGAAGGFLDYLGYPFCRGRIFDTLEEDKGQYNDNLEIFWATGACLFIKSEIFHETGGFDADFFAHMEEIDLCWRIKSEGYKIFVCGDSEVYHVGGGTLHKSNPRKTFLNFRNGLAMLYKNHPSEKLFIHIFTRLILDGLAGVKFILSGNFADCFVIIKAHFNFYFNLGKWTAKRRKIKQGKNLQGIYKSSIVLAYFMKGKKLFSDLSKEIYSNV